MPHDVPLIALMAGGLVLAFVFGALANRLGLPPLIGYLVAGVLAGPHTPGFTADGRVSEELLELGVILLMFGVGLHFSFRDLLAVRRIAIPGAVAQIALATLLGMGLAALFGWSFGAGLVFGLALSVASTVVLLKALEERELIDSPEGHIAIGWLIVEDLVMVLTLVLLPALAGVLRGDSASVDGMQVLEQLGWTLLKVAAFIAVMLVGGRRVIPWILERVVYTGSRELFRLGVLATALGVAYGASEMFGVSFALGAFFAGMVLAESEFSQRAADETLPLRDAFSVLFFVAVGMLFDPMVLVRETLAVAATLLIIIVGKSIAAYLIVVGFGYPRLTGMTISASLAQIGEFSFILVAMGVAFQILPPHGRDLILAGALLSILLNPLVFRLLDGYRARHLASAA